MNSRTPLLLALVAAPAAAQFHAPEVETTYVGYTVASYPVGLSPWASVAGDFDGDGALDLATASWPTNARLTILFGDGLGGFAPPVDHPSLGGQGIAAADLEGDGDLDLLVSEFSDASFAVYENDGTGGFLPPVHHAAGVAPVGIGTADLDGDGRLDVLVAHKGSSMAMMLNDGAGGFFPPQVIVLDSGTRDLGVGDLDGDGDADVVVGHTTKKISVLVNNGLGFDFPVTYDSVPSGFFNDEANVHLADVDLDGDLDALFSSASTGLGIGGPGYGSIALFRGNGDGTFGAAEAIPMDPTGDGAYDVAVADVTGDGWPDLLATAGGYGFWCLVPGDGAGGFAAARSYYAGERPFLAEAGDLDGDGDLDAVVVAQGSLEACVFLNPGAGDFSEPLYQDVVDESLAPASSSKLAHGDIDGDGDLDVVVGYSANFQGVYGLSVRRNDGEGALAPAEDYSETAFPAVVELADVSGDGLLDVLWRDDPTTFSPKFRYRLNLGDGTFGPTRVGPGNFCGYDPGFEVADVNGDGLLDVLVGECIDKVYTLLNTGQGFAAPLVHEVGTSPTALATGDLDGDGHLDLVTNTGVQGYVEVSLGNGDGTYLAPFTQQCGRGVSDIAVADLDEDGILDLAASFQLDGDGVTVLLGRGDGSFKPSEEYPGSYSGYADNVAVTDLDGDGHLDLLTANPGSDVSFWRNAGDGTFEPVRRYGAGRPATSVAPGDWTGDGVLDLATLLEPTGGPGGWYYPSVAILEGRPALWSDLGNGLAGAAGVPALGGAGTLAGGASFALALDGAPADAAALYVVGFAEVDVPLAGGVLVPSPNVFVPLTTSPTGEHGATSAWPAGQPSGFELFFQAWIVDPTAPSGVAATNGLRARQP